MDQKMRKWNGADYSFLSSPPVDFIRVLPPPYLKRVIYINNEKMIVEIRCFYIDYWWSTDHY